jgi:sterol desaturase/sphingolipid hydroxylase (fatty acid hydroxylase superfamily)
MPGFYADRAAVCHGCRAVTDGTEPWCSRLAVRQALFPALVLAMGGFAVVGPSLRVASALGLPETVNDTLLLLGAIGFFYSVLALLERMQPHRADWSRPQGDVRTDALHLVVTGPTSAIVFGATLRGLGVAGGAWVASRIGAPVWPVGWPLPLQLVLAVLISELGHYWWHRLAHEHDLLWRLHATHHSARRLYWLNATRFHPIDLFALIVFQTTPLLLLGIEHDALLSYALFSSVYGQIQHSNIDLRPNRLFEWIFSTPTVHRWHHSVDVGEANHNYAAILNAWDLLFGTYFRPEGRGFTGPVGIADMPAFPRGYVGQVLAPFRWGAVAAGSTASTAIRRS